MQASIVDLRYNMSEIKKAIENNQIIAITDRGSVIADIFPRGRQETFLAEEHPFFGSAKTNDASVEKVMSNLRGDGYDDL